MIAAELLRGRAHPVRLVVFDCDGVLVDSEPVSNRVVAREMTALGWPMTQQEADRAFLGMNVDDMRLVVEARLGRVLPPDWEEALVARLIAVMQDEVTAISGALAALDGVTALGLPWRVASNSSHPEMAAKFASIGIAERVAGRAHSFTDVPRGKPAPDVYLAAAAAEGVPPECCVAIEDSATGARAAVAAGMTCLGFAPHGGAHALIAAGAAPFAAMAELPVLLRLAPR